MDQSPTPVLFSARISLSSSGWSHSLSDPVSAFRVLEGQTGAATSGLILNCLQLLFVLGKPANITQIFLNNDSSLSLT